MSHGVSFGTATRVWARVALHSFGGPAAQIAVMHRVLVDERKWIGERRFLGALNYCMLLPGPEAQQLATYLGWLLHGWAGGLVAGGLFVLPGLLSLAGLSVLYVHGQDVAVVNAVFWGVKAAVIAVVVEALDRIRRRALTSPGATRTAVVAFAAIALLGVPFPLVLLGAAASGARRAGTSTVAPVAEDAVIDRMLAEAPPARLNPSTRRTLGTLALWLVLWLGPVAALTVVLGPTNVFAQVARFFSVTATVTFGGAYSVLAYVAQQAVGTHRWLDASEMLDGLALAESTPGPLIQVVQFVGFLATYRSPGPLPPLAAGLLGSLLTCWVTFTPSFLWIFVGAPWIERIRGNARWQGALAGITAAVVGVIAQLAVWSAVHVVFREVPAPSGWLAFPVPVLSSLDPLALALVVAALVATFRLRVGMFGVLLGGAAAGTVRWLLGIAPG